MKVIWQFLHDPHQYMYPHCSIILNRKKAKYKCPTVQRFLNYSSLMVEYHGPIKKYQKTNRKVKFKKNPKFHVFHDYELSIQMDKD